MGIWTVTNFIMGVEEKFKVHGDDTSQTNREIDGRFRTINLLRDGLY